MRNLKVGFRWIFAATLAAAAGLHLGAVSLADGWHGAAMSTQSLDDWLSDLKAVVPDLEKRLDSAELRAGKNPDDLRKLAESKKGETGKGLSGGGKIDAKLTPEQQAMLSRKAADCMDVLAYMDSGNIFPQEFPNFPMTKISSYRATAKKLIGLMGPAGTNAVVNQLRGELMGNANQQFSDVKPHKDFQKDMLEALASAAKNGGISEEDLKSLMEAAAGRKNPAQAELAKKAMEILVSNADLETLMKVSKQAEDPAIKKILGTKTAERLNTADLGTLLKAAGETLDDNLTKQLTQKVKERLPNAEVPDLISLLNDDALGNDAIKQTATKQLGTRSPTYKEVKDSVPALQNLAQSKDQAVADAARGQLENAFQRAPIPECLRWLGENDKSLTPLIWEQVDARIERADAARKADYRETGLKSALDKEAVPASRAAALDFLGRLNDREAVGPLIEVLPQLPKELWPQAGATLRKITGEKFGPVAGGGVAELTVELKKWRAWWKENGGK